jgi:hypothetical protein
MDPASSDGHAARAAEVDALRDRAGLKKLLESLSKPE